MERLGQQLEQRRRDSREQLEQQRRESRLREERQEEKREALERQLAAQQKTVMELLTRDVCRKRSTKVYHTSSPLVCAIDIASIV